MQHTRALLGFTLAELMVTLAVVGIVTALAAPSLSGFIERLRLSGAAELAYSQLTFARNEAVKRSKPIFVSFEADGSPNWSFGITDRIGGCDPAITEPEAPTACSIDLDNDPSTADRALFRFSSEDHPNVSLPSPRFGVAQSIPCASGLSASDTCFDPMRGTARNGSAHFTAGAYAASTVISVMGRTRICTPAGSPTLPGYPKC